MSGLFVPLDVDYADDPKIIEAGPLAELLFVRGLAFCKQQLSDGHIARSQLSRMTTVTLKTTMDQSILKFFQTAGNWRAHPQISSSFARS